MYLCSYVVKILSAVVKIETSKTLSAFDDKRYKRINAFGVMAPKLSI
jgi:hypothetical protein